MRIDSHQHFWQYSAGEYPWIQPDWPIRRDFLPEDLAPELHRCRLDGCIAVQARQSLEETRWLLDLADQSSFIRGVVGWVDLRAEDLADTLQEFAKRPKLRGVRHVVQDEPDDLFMLRADFQRGIGMLKDFDLAYDILVYPRQLPAAVEMVRAFPSQTFVLDHLGKPLIRDRVLGQWLDDVQKLGAAPNVSCKISGMVTEAPWRTWTHSEFAPYLDVVFAAFGPHRVLYGSDWPVALLSASYEQVYGIVHDYVAVQYPAMERQIFGGNAIRIYRLN